MEKMNSYYLHWKPKFDKRKSNKYINKLWGFALDLGRYWYEVKESYLDDDFILCLLVADPSVGTEQQPFFRQDRFPMQANIQIGPEPGPSSWNKTSSYGTKYMLSRGYKILGEHHITVYGTDHYAISYMLGGQIPTRKYSVVFEHPRLKQYIEFAFTISFYGSIEDFGQNIGEGDMLVRSFEWL